MTAEREMTELELDLTAKLAIARTHIKFLLDYARRVAQHQVTRQDLERVQNARMFAVLMEDKKDA